MRIPIDRESSTPVYQQIQQFLEAQIISGSLSPNSRLPSTRDLAVNLGIGRLTVNNAYAELQAKGLVYSLRGDGTYVSKNPSSMLTTAMYKEEDWPDWQKKVYRPAGESLSQQLLNLLAAANRPGTISFTSSSGDSSLFPLEDFRHAMRSVMSGGQKDILGYGETAGYLPLRKTVADILASQGIPAHAEEVMITSGSQQALNLVIRLLVRPGEQILVERPTHKGMIDLCQSLGIELLEISMDEQGMQVEHLEPLLNQNNPRLIFTVPSFHNPTGTCLNTARRRQLVETAARHGVPILEDDYIGDLRYKGAAQPALKALDTCGNVIYVSTFSKMLIPSLRVGFLVANGPIFKTLLSEKRIYDITSSELMQHALQTYISVGKYQLCLKRARKRFSRRLAVMDDVLKRTMPAGVTWVVPQGGIFMWLKLPDNRSSDKLFPYAAEQGVLFTPGSYFFPYQEESPYIRLTFASQPEAQIEEGIQRLGQAIKIFLNKNN